MGAHKIQIEVNASTHKLEYTYTLDGSPNGTGPIVHVSPGDSVRWYSKSEKFGVHFDNNHSPFVGDTFLITAEKSSSDSGSGHHPTDPPLGVRSHVFDQTYKYFVASAKKSGSKEVVTDDPEIIVDGTGGGGP